MSSVPRSLPPSANDERAMLRSWLDFHRATFERKLEGLTPVQLAAHSVEPSQLTLLGLLRHHAEVERYNFGVVFRGDPDVPFFTEDDFVDLHDVDEALVADAFGVWRRACDQSRAIEAAAGLDDLSPGPGLFDDQPVSLRWMLLHAIEEYARHNGHADLLRERIDGKSGW